MKSLLPDSKKLRDKRCLLNYLIQKLKKNLFKQRIPKATCAKKETVELEILITSRNGEKKIMNLIGQ